MTQLLAHQSAEGFGPPLADAVQDDARVIHELGRRRTPTALAALRAFQAMCTIDTQRELARMNADRLVEHGLPEPPWGSRLGRVRVDGCWWAHDQLDETAILLCAFSYDGADEHAILALIDRTVGGGLIRELTLGTEVDPLLQALHRADGGVDGFVSEQLDPAYARRLLEDAVATSDEVTEYREYEVKPVPAAYRKMRALTLARARALSEVATAPEPLPSTVEIELMKQTFLASGSAAGLPRADATSRAVDLLVTHFVEQAACHPVQLGPRRIQAVLGLPILAPDAIGGPEVARILPDVAGAWISWTAAERGLTGNAAEQLERAAAEAQERLRSAGIERENPT
ncbi:hypothetical protein Pen02_33290 [Plantactinospora endophytica]|uniref:Uncharacterized protein n=2 Tax=Plantactinospora endophytica TaxID=673535 RepID=A0ABQ4E102_9ACTN|nr:hypothetical protein Pen02_33290 [Plantactinospora endophytica]